MAIALLPLVMAVVAVVAADQRLPPTATQLADFKKTHGAAPLLKTGAGAVVEERDTKLLNSNLINSEYFMDEFQSLVRSRTPERVVHASGVGGFGYFEVTHDISHICNAKVFSKVGKKTPVAARMSVTSSRQGSPDTTQGSRGCAFKWYTEDGNFDLTGFGVPLFTNKDPAKVLGLINTLKENPVTNVRDQNMRWDFVLKNPEAIMKSMYEFSDYGAPVSYKDMPCHAVHTYQVYNDQGVSSFVRFHLIPCEGAKYLNASEAQKVASGDPNYYAKGFFNTIANGDYPCYDLKAQILSDEDRKNCDMDIFDVTKVLDEKRYPYTPIGRVIINKNCENHHQDIESQAYSPGNLVHGILGSPDKLFESRRFVYRDSQIWRLGSNYKNIPVNCPIQGPVQNYIRGGYAPYNPNVSSGPSYYPNSFNGPVATVDKKQPQLIKIHEQPADNFKQAGDFYKNVLTPPQRTTLINNMVKSLCTCTQEIKKEAVKYLKMINPDFGNRVAKGVQAQGTVCP